MLSLTRSLAVDRGPDIRAAAPEEVAGLAAYLASDEADYISGTDVTSTAAISAWADGAQENQSRPSVSKSSEMWLSRMRVRAFSRVASWLTT